MIKAWVSSASHLSALRSSPGWEWGPSNSPALSPLTASPASQFLQFTGLLAWPGAELSTPCPGPPRLSSSRQGALEGRVSQFHCKCTPGPHPRRQDSIHRDSAPLRSGQAPPGPCSCKVLVPHNPRAPSGAEICRAEGRGCHVRPRVAEAPLSTPPPRHRYFWGLSSWPDEAAGAGPNRNQRGGGPSGPTASAAP